MTTAPARAVPSLFATTLRASLMAAASGALLVALAPGAKAASCVSSPTASDVCVINLSNINDTHDGQAHTSGNGDTLQFDDNANPLTLAAKRIGTGTAAAAPGTNFVNFEFAEIVNNTTLTLTSTAPVAPTPADPPAAIGAWTIAVGSTLNVSGTGGNAIGDFSSMTVNGTFNVIESETLGALSGSGLIVVSATEVLSAGGSGAKDLAGDVIGTTFSGVISGAGGFAKVGSGMFKLTGVNTFTGPLTVSGGTLEVGNVNAISTANGLLISNGAELTSKGVANYNINGPVNITAAPAGARPSRLTGNAIITGNVSSNGGLQPGNTSIPTFPAGSLIGNPGQDMGSMRINGNYTATGPSAYVGMFINIDAALAINTAAGTNIVTPTGNFISPAANGTAGTTHDFLDIVGNVTTTGSDFTTFSVASFTASPTGGATTGNGIQVIRITGTNNGNEFRQGNSMVAGPYQYLLKYVKDYNAALDDGYFLQSATRDELVAHATVLSAGQAALRHCFRDDQRVPDSPKGATYGRAWVGYRQGSTSFGPDTGIDASEDFSCTTGGMDWRMGAGWIGGVSGGFGEATGDLTTAAGEGAFTGNLRVIEAYAAFTSSVFFLNLSGGYADADWIYTGRLMGSAIASTGGFIGSAQAGIGLGVEPVAMKLIGSVNYDGTDCGESCFGLASTEETGLIEAKASLRFDGLTWGGSVRPWAMVSYSSVLSDGINKVSMGAVSVTADTNDELLSIDAGMQSYLDQNLALFLDGGYHESLQKDISGYRAGLGLKLYW